MNGLENYPHLGYVPQDYWTAHGEAPKPDDDYPDDDNDYDDKRFVVETSEKGRYALAKTNLLREEFEQAAAQQIYAFGNPPSSLNLPFRWGTYDGQQYSFQEYLSHAQEMSIVPRIGMVDSQGNKLGTPTVLRVALQIAHGLDFMHETGVIHRDIKPGNVLIDDTYTAYVVDFGLAIPLDRQKDERKHFSPYRMAPGTPPYMSPEQAQMIRIDIDLTPSSDLFNFGMMVHEMCTGDSASQKGRSNDPETLDDRANNFICSSVIRHPNNPYMNHLKANQVVSKMLSKNPEDRYSTATVFIEELASALGVDLTTTI